MRGHAWFALGLVATLGGMLGACGDDDAAPADAGAGADADGAAGDAGPPPTLPPRGALVLVLRDDGRLDVTDDAGTAYLRGATAQALVREASGAEQTVSTAACAGAAWRALDGVPRPGASFASFTGHALTCTVGGATRIEWRVWDDVARGAVLLFVSVENAGGAPVRVLRLSPLVVEGPDAGLFVGLDPARHRILDDGADVVREIETSLHYPDERRGIVLGALPIASRGDVVSDWNHAIVDLDGARSWTAGFLAVERGVPTIGTRLDSGSPAVDPATHRRGFTGLYADSVLLLDGKELAPGGSVDSEPLWIDPLAPDPWSGLEHFADAISGYAGVEPWTRRDGGHPVPTGWNSWTGSGSTGGLGTNIDEALMAEELDVMAREMGPFGVDYFQIDDGWQAEAGDWVGHPMRFPSGMPAIATQVRARALVPGLWAKLFVVSTGSALAAAHPDWLADPADNAFGSAFSPGADSRTLDLSSPEVVTWLEGTARRLREEEGIEWLKLDFAYLAMPYRGRADPSLTSMEAYVRALRAVRTGLGPDVFFLGIGLLGPNFGIADGMRTSLDGGPVWEQRDPVALLGSGGSFKTMVRSGAGRYYFHGHAWVNHDDLLFFRTSTEEPDPPVTMQEAITLASFMGLAGTIVKFGEDLRTLTPEQVNVWRKLLPIYPVAARPLDLFTRKYPEVYALRVDGTLAGSAARWAVVGLLNWGRNYDYSTPHVTELPDAARSYDVALEELGLDASRDYLAQEFWSERFLGVVRGTLARTVGAHDHEVIALREATGHPQLLGTNRQLTQGATDLVSEAWDEATRTLHVVMQVDAGPAGSVPFEYRVRVYAPPGLTARAGTGLAQEGEVVTITFTPAASATRTIDVVFD